MPGGNGTGPLRQGPVGGRGFGRGRGRGRGQFGAGPEGYCVCPKCGEKTIHRAGVPCASENCPKCGSIMVRE